MFRDEEPVENPIVAPFQIERLPGKQLAGGGETGEPHLDDLPDGPLQDRSDYRTIARSKTGTPGVRADSQEGIPRQVRPWNRRLTPAPGKDGHVPPGAAT